MEERNTIREKASDLSSRIESKQIEALAHNVKTLKCIDELQELLVHEQGYPSINVEEARKGLQTAAISLVAEQSGDDIDKARDSLKQFGYPMLLDWATWDNAEGRAR